MRFLGSHDNQRGGFLKQLSCLIIQIMLSYHVVIYDNHFKYPLEGGNMLSNGRNVSECANLLYLVRVLFHCHITLEDLSLMTLFCVDSVFWSKYSEIGNSKTSYFKKKLL